MKVKAHLTEKTMADAKNGKYTFWVGVNDTKYEVKENVSKLFSVKVETVRTVNYKSRTWKNYAGKMKKVTAGKKAVVTLKGKDKIDVFETKK